MTFDQGAKLWRRRCVLSTVFFRSERIKKGATVELLCLPLPQMWAPGNTADCPAPQQPGRTCDSPSGCRPRTGAPLHHPVKTKQTSVCVYASVDAMSVRPQRSQIHPYMFMHILVHWPIWHEGLSSVSSLVLHHHSGRGRTGEVKLQDAITRP